MKGGTLLVTNLVILAIGIVLIAAFRRADFLHTIIFITGILFVVPGVINIVSLLREGKKSKENPEGRPFAARLSGWATCCAALILGVSMIIVPEAYRELLVYVFSLILLLGGCYHLYMIAKGLKPAQFPMWVYALPVALIVAACVMLFTSGLKQPSGQSAVVLITGIGLVVFSATSFIEMVAMRAVRRGQKELAADTSRQIEDVDAREVK